MAEARLYLITGLSPPMGLGQMVEKALDGGVDLVQLRDKGSEAAPLLEALEMLRKITQRYGALLIVNDRLDLALASDADGVHLGQSDLPVEEARKRGGKELFIGLSTHSEDQILGASSQADYLGVGPVHATPTKPGRPAVGTELVRFASGNTSRPFFTIGGIDLDTLPSVIAAGATRVAVLRAIADSDDPAGVARKMKEMLLGSGDSTV